MAKAHTITVCKQSQRRLDSGIVGKQLDYAVNRALAGGRGTVWSGSYTKPAVEDYNGEFVYTTTFTFRRNGRSTNERTEMEQFGRIRNVVAGALRGRGWNLNDGESKDQSRVEEAQHPEAAQQPGYADVKINIEDTDGHFKHLYNLDNQISLVLSSVKEYERSQFANRFHCVLYGEPACGKTEILRSLTRMLGKDAVMHFDATSTTSAGAKQLLTESSYIPPVLCIEEIEKADEVSLRWLLGVLDYRAEVRALKYRAGLVAKEVKLLCLATVNDFGLFGRMMDGALASRFSHKIYCPRPGRVVLQKILEREVARTNGDPAWIQPALDYCLDKEKTNDPRRIITVCLCGRERLLTGEYQQVLAATRAPTN